MNKDLRYQIVNHLQLLCEAQSAGFSPDSQVLPGEF